MALTVRGAGGAAGTCEPLASYRAAAAAASAAATASAACCCWVGDAAADVPVKEKRPLQSPEPCELWAQPLLRRREAPRRRGASGEGVDMRCHRGSLECEREDYP